MNQGTNGADPSSPPPTTTITTPTPKPITNTPTPEPEPVNVDALGLVGMTCDEALAAATSAGLVPTCANGTNPAPSDELVGTVESVSPRGSVKTGTPVTLTLFMEAVQVGGPTSAPTLGGPAIAGQKVTLNWTNFECPSGLPVRSAYEVTLTNATFDGTATTQSFAAGVRNAQITINPYTAGQNVTATYRAFCGESRPSDNSPQMEELIEPDPDDESGGILG